MTTRNSKTNANNSNNSNSNTQNTNKMSKFATATRKRMEENSDSNIPARNEKMAKAALDGQIASLNMQLVHDEQALEGAKERLENAFYPTHQITDGQTYISTIVTAQKQLDAATAKVEATKESIEYYEEILATRF